MDLRVDNRRMSSPKLTQKIGLRSPRAQHAIASGSTAAVELDQLGAMKENSPVQGPCRPVATVSGPHTTIQLTSHATSAPETERGRSGGMCTNLAYLDSVSDLQIPRGFLNEGMGRGNADAETSELHVEDGVAVTEEAVDLGTADIIIQT